MFLLRSNDKLSQFMDEIRLAGGDDEFIEINVTRRDDGDALVTHAVETFRNVEAWVANAGVRPIGLMNDRAVADWDVMVDVNIKDLLWRITATCASPRFSRDRRRRVLPGTSGTTA